MDAIKTHFAKSRISNAIAVKRGTRTRYRNERQKLHDGLAPAAKLCHLCQDLFRGAKQLLEKYYNDPERAYQHRTILDLIDKKTANCSGGFWNTPIIGSWSSCLKRRPKTLKNVPFGLYPTRLRKAFHIGFNLSIVSVPKAKTNPIYLALVETKVLS